MTRTRTGTGRDTTRGAKATYAALGASCAAGIVCLAGFGTPARVLAYSDRAEFGYPAAVGGGDGRYFTGSPADGYTCKSCHVQGKPAQVYVLGLPEAGYVPAAKYEITVDWSDDLTAVSANVEITDMVGRRAGTVRLAQGDELQDPELCETPAVPAARVLDVVPRTQSDLGYCSRSKERRPNDCRQVLYVSSCGAQRLRFLWTAPSWDIGPLWFAGSVVSADGDGSNEGDGVTDLGRVFASEKSQAERESVASCSALPTSHATTHPIGLGLPLWALALKRGLRRLTRLTSRTRSERDPVSQ